MAKAIINQLVEGQIFSHTAIIKNTFSRIFGRLISSIFERLFHEPMGDGVMKFFWNLSYVGLGTVISTVFSFSYNVIAGRVLGPSGYGGFTLVQSIAMFLYIPMLLGLHTAMIRYCAGSTEQLQQRKIISTTYIVALCLTIVSVLLYGIFRHQVADLFSVSQEIITLSVLFAVLFAVYTLATSSLRGLHLMKDYAFFQPIYGVTLLTALLVFIYFQFYSFKAMVYASFLAYGIVGSIIVLIFLKRYLTFRIDRSWLSKLWKYSSLSVIGGLSFTLYTNIDRIMINYYMDVGSVGMYSVYYYASFTMLALFSGIFTTVFFPAVSKTRDKGSIYRKLNKTIPYLLILGIPFALIGEYIILQFFGKDYSIQLPLLIMFAVAGVLVTWYGIYAWFFNSEGVKGARLTVSGTLIIAVANIALNIVLIPLVGLYGAIGATALAFTFGLYYNFYRGKNFFTNTREDEYEPNP